VWCVCCRSGAVETADGDVGDSDDNRLDDDEEEEDDEENEGEKSLDTRPVLPQHVQRQVSYEIIVLNSITLP